MKPMPLSPLPRQTQPSPTAPCLSADCRTGPLPAIRSSTYTREEMPAIQILAYASTAALLVCAWRIPRVRLYTAFMLASDLARLALQQSKSPSLALYGADGLLVVFGPITLSHCLGADPWPLVGLGMVSMGVALWKAHGCHYGAVTSIYVASLLVGHLYATVAPLTSRKWRRNIDIESLVLLLSAGSGFAGAITMLAWSEWDLVCMSNVVVNVVLAIICLLAGRDDDRV